MNKKKTTIDFIRDHLLANKSITVLEATHPPISTVDLRRYITDLRREGLEIEDEWIKNENTKKRFKRYFLRPKT